MAILPFSSSLSNFTPLTLLHLLLLLLLSSPISSETRPPVRINIINALIGGHNFNIVAAMLAASGVVSELEADEAGAGITIFVPTDRAFVDLPSSIRFQSLPADKKAMVLRFHVLHSYYPLASLESIVNPIYPTLATEQSGAGTFTVNISRVNGSVAIDSGIVVTSITQKVFDHSPVAIFGVSKVLLPKEYFGHKPANEVMVSAQPPDTIAAMSPDNSPAMYGPASHLSSPELELRSWAGGEEIGGNS